MVTKEYEKSKDSEESRKDDGFGKCPKCGRILFIRIGINGVFHFCIDCGMSLSEIEKLIKKGLKG